MLMRPLISPTAMKACQQAESASRNSDVAAGRGPGRAKLIKAINPRFRSTGFWTAEHGHLRIARCGAAKVAQSLYLAIWSILSRLSLASVNRLPAHVGDFLRFR